MSEYKRCETMSSCTRLALAQGLHTPQVNTSHGLGT